MQNLSVQPTAFVQNVPSTTNGLTPYRSAAIGLGGTGVTIGILTFIFQCVAIGATTPSSAVATGIWVGIMFIVTGSIGIVSSKKDSQGLAVAFLAFNSLSMIFAVALIISASISMINISTKCNSYNYRNDGRSYTTPQYNECKNEATGIAAESILIFLAFLEIIIAIISSGFGCGRLCCTAPNQLQAMYQGQVGTVFVLGAPAEGYQPQQMAVVQGQVYPNQPSAYQMHQSQVQGQPQPQIHSPGPEIPPSTPQGQLRQSEEHDYQNI